MENTGVIETIENLAEVTAVENKTNPALENSCKRAMDEVSALEMAQQILAMVEGSLKKPLVKDYSIAGVKKFLHELYELDPGTSLEEINGMEFIFWQEAQLWRSALAQRDSFISVSDLRHYCETSRPPLSSQAIMALARFYRSLPAAEKTTAKFDMIITRAFTKDEEDGARRLSSSRTAITESLDELYREWLGISPQIVLNEEKITEAVDKFNDFIVTAEKAASFETLITDNFFGTVKNYKNSLGKIFYVPQVVAAAIDCNIRIGNKFVELLDKYKQGKKSAGQPAPLDPALEQVVSETTSKSLQAVFEQQKVHEKLEKQRELQRELEKETFSLPDAPAVRKSSAGKSGDILGINKWLLIGGLVAVLLSGALYVWSEYGGAADQSSKSAQKLNEKELPGGENLNAARVNNSTFFGIVITAKWTAMSDDEKRKMLGDLLGAGKDKGYTQVTVLNNEGKLVGRAGENGVNLF